MTLWQQQLQAYIVSVGLQHKGQVKQQIKLAGQQQSYYADG